MKSEECHGIFHSLLENNSQCLVLQMNQKWEGAKSNGRFTVAQRAVEREIPLMPKQPVFTFEMSKVFSNSCVIAVRNELHPKLDARSDRRFAWLPHS